MPFPPFKFQNGALKILDQRRLPSQEIWIACRDSKKVYWAIRNMTVRGAPAIGIVGGYGLYLGIAAAGARRAAPLLERKIFLKKLEREAEYLKSARPTGANLRNVIDRIVEAVKRHPAARARRAVPLLKKMVLAEARKAHAEDDRLCRAIGRHGASLIRSGEQILTHCNAGGLATSGYGTALGVFYAAKALGKKISVFADETRPLLQGARLTAWELAKSRIPCTLLCDNSAASLMRAGKIDRVIVGADRIAANGDTANKIGTYNLAVLAKAHGIPFYIAAPSTTFDATAKSGRQIPIEQRNAKEVTEGFGKKIAPAGTRALNPAFDVTPHRLITAFITDKGILKRPFAESFKRLRKEKRQ